MILITVMKEDGTGEMTYPHNSDNVAEAEEKFLGFAKENPAIILGSKIAKVRKVTMMDEISEIEIPEPDIKALCENVLRLIRS